MRIVILDTGCANLASVTYALKRLGYDPVVSREHQTIINADKLLLPGVGTAQAAMQQLEQRQLIELIKSCTQPVLGICLGMQLLASASEEGNISTLGIIDAQVSRIADTGLPLPHMGWNRVQARPNHPLFNHIDDNAHFYFVHGFALPVGDYTIAQTQYGLPITAAVQQDNFFGVQFHPERSGAAGARLLQNFLEM